MTVAGPTVVLGQAKRHAEQRAVLAARADVKDAIVFVNEVRGLWEL
jgi:hypothetical protein